MIMLMYFFMFRVGVLIIVENVAQVVKYVILITWILLLSYGYSLLLDNLIKIILYSLYVRLSLGITRCILNLSKFVS